MKITKYIHSCLLIEKGDDRLLFDPGKFSFVEGLVDPGEFKDLTAIILTHFHPDHLDEKAIGTITENNPTAPIYANLGIVEKLGEKNIEALKFSSGTRTIGGFSIEALDAPHAWLLNAEPPQNKAYVLDEMLLVPGDSYAGTLDAKEGIAVLALPVMAPWTTELGTADFVSRIAPKEIIPIHDGYAKDFFLKMRYDNFEDHFAKTGIKFHRLEKAGDSVELG